MTIVHVASSEPGGGVNPLIEGRPFRAFVKQISGDVTARPAALSLRDVS